MFFPQGILVLSLNFLIKSTETAVRNPLTNRCISLNSNEGQETLRVRSTECFWKGTKIDFRVNDVEIVPTGVKGQRSSIHFKIQQTGSTLCLRVEDEDTVRVGVCNGSASVFIIEPHPLKGNEKAGEEGQAYVIKGFKRSSNCLTVTLGQPDLAMVNCSSGNPLQRWTVCRGPPINCDVDLTWSPAKISFPDDSNNLIDVGDKSPVNQNNYNKTEEPRKSQTVGPHKNLIVNEPLYFISNALRSPGLNSSQAIGNILTNFYTPEELDKALDLVEGISRTKKPQKHWTKGQKLVEHFKNQQQDGGLDGEKVVFVSENLHKIPPIRSFRPRNSSMAELCKCLRSSWDREEMEGVSDKQGQISPTDFSEVDMKGVRVQSFTSKLQVSPNPEEGAKLMESGEGGLEDEDYNWPISSLINLRFNKRSQRRNGTRSYPRHSTSFK